MSRDDVERRIRENMGTPTTIDAEDLSPPVCVWCGKELVGPVDVVLWDIPEKGDESVVHRYRYCSEKCCGSDRSAVMNNEDPHPHGAPERLEKDERDAMTDGGQSEDEPERSCQGCGAPMEEIGAGDFEWWRCTDCGYERGEFLGS